MTSQLMKHRSLKPFQLYPRRRSSDLLKVFRSSKKFIQGSTYVLSFAAKQQQSLCLSNINTNKLSTISSESQYALKSIRHVNFALMNGHSALIICTKDYDRIVIRLAGLLCIKPFVYYYVRWINQGRFGLNPTCSEFQLSISLDGCM